MANENTSMSLLEAKVIFYHQKQYFLLLKNVLQRTKRDNSIVEKYFLKFFKVEELFCCKRNNIFTGR